MRSELPALCLTNSVQYRQSHSRPLSVQWNKRASDSRLNLAFRCTLKKVYECSNNAIASTLLSAHSQLVSFNRAEMWECMNSHCSSSGGSQHSFDVIVVYLKIVAMHAQNSSFQVLLGGSLSRSCTPSSMWLPCPVAPTRVLQLTPVAKKSSLESGLCKCIEVAPRVQNVNFAKYLFLKRKRTKLSLLFKRARFKLGDVY